MVILLMASGILNCSGFVFKTFYKNLDTLLESRVSSYLAITDAQEDFLEARIQTHYQWHRYQELPQYAVFFQDLAGRVERGLSREDLEFVRTKTRDFRIRVAHRVYPDAIKILKEFPASRIAEQEKLIAEYNEDLAATVSMPGNERYQERLESNIEFFEFFTGNLTEEQRKRVERYTRESRDTAPLYLAYRRMNQTRLMSLLKKGPDGHQELENFMKTYFFNWESLYPPEYRSVARQNRILFYETTLDLDRSLSKEQRKKASEKLRELSTNFLELSGKL